MGENRIVSQLLNEKNMPRGLVWQSWARKQQVEEKQRKPNQDQEQNAGQ
jgi:hypothetical protein